ncbi:MAG: NAD(P)/FAD-dependent oxidoreductase [Promethearchaeota archaeon]
MVRKKKLINLVLKTVVEEIIPDKKQVITGGHQKLDYNKLFICTGFHNYVPPIENVTLEGVFSLRTLSDALEIKSYVQDKKEVTCIGGGFLGLELARNLIKAGLQVTVIEFFPRLLPRQLCDESSSVFRKKMEELGIKTRLDSVVTKIIGKQRAEAVELKNGDVLPADAVFVSAGVRPNVEIASSAGLMVNKGIVVNEFLQTSDENIYAVGDVAEFNGKFWAIIPAARDQAPIAAKHALGLKVEP